MPTDTTGIMTNKHSNGIRSFAPRKIFAKKKKDGGPGHVGTIVLIGHSSNPSCLPGTVLVLWDNGKIQNYRAGMDLHG